MDKKAESDRLWETIKYWGAKKKIDFLLRETVFFMKAAYQWEKSAGRWKEKVELWMRLAERWERRYNEESSKVEKLEAEIQELKEYTTKKRPGRPFRSYIETADLRNQSNLVVVRGGKG